MAPVADSVVGFKAESKCLLSRNREHPGFFYALYLIWAYANVYVLLLGGAMMKGVFNRGHAFYPDTYLGDGEGLHLDWGKVSEYDCVELFLYVVGPLFLYIVSRLIYARGHDPKET